MERFIPKSVLDDRLEKLKARLLPLTEQHYPMDIQETAKSCIKTIESMEELQGMQRPEERSERTVSVEPFFEGGAIGRDVYRCHKCGNRVGCHDVYCLTCGRRLYNAPAQKEAE